MLDFYSEHKSRLEWSQTTSLNVNLSLNSSNFFSGFIPGGLSLSCLIFFLDYGGFMKGERSAEPCIYVPTGSAKTPIPGLV